MKSLNGDKIAGVIFAAATLVLLVVFFNNSAFFHWAFERHQNMLSWYIRPVFLIPFCYFSYIRSWSGVSVTIFCLLTSMFWFPVPAVIDDQVKEFLMFEKEWLMSQWDLTAYSLTLLIPISLATLSAAIWQRNFFVGILVLVMIALSKVGWSIYFAGQSGLAVVAPAIFGLIVCIGFVWLHIRRRVKRVSAESS